MAEESTHNTVSEARVDTVIQAHTIAGVHFHQPATAPVPRQLPADVAHFTDRDVFFAALDHWLERDRPDAPRVIVGVGGVGKTSLATRWAHRVRDRFPDGDLYLDLRGYHADSELTTADALDHLLRSLDVPADRLPAAEATKATLYRTLTYGKQILVFLDNAATVGQVRPLLPGSGTCRVLITSRGRLTGLVSGEGARLMALDVLPEREAVALLTRIVGEERAADAAAVGDLARLCGYLPLALRIAASRLLLSSSLSVPELVAELAESRGRLDSLADDEQTVRAVFSWSYRALDPATARAFRLLSVPTGGDIGLPAAAALLDLAPARARRELDALVNAHLLREDTPGRFHFHDLVHLYADERCAAEDDPAEVRAAFRRAATWYAHTAKAAAAQVTPIFSRIEADPPASDHAPPAFADPAAALHWYNAEQANLLAAVEQAGELGESDLAWQLPVALFGAFLVRRPLRTWVRTHLIGIEAATADGRLPVVAWLHTSVGLAYRGLREYPAAVRHLEAGLDAWRELGERWAQAWAMRDLGHVHSLMGDHARAEGMLRTALEMHVAEGDSFGEATALALLGAVELGLDRPDDALGSFRRSLAIREEHGDPRTIAIVRTELSTALLRVGDLESALAEAAGALELNQAIDDWRCEAMAHEALGNAKDATGDRAGAVEHWRAALVLFDKLGDPHADDLRTRAG